MTIIDPGYSEAAATVFTWLADKVLGGAKKALGWGWERAQWVAAQDRYDEQIIKQYGWIRIFGQTTPKPLKEVFTDVYMLDKPTAFARFAPKALREQLWEQDRSIPLRQGERLPAEQLLGRGSKFLILGKPGAGKTTFLKHLAVREAQRGKWGPCLGKIPIFVPLKQFAESGKSLFDFIVDQFAVCHFPDAAPFVEPLLKAGKALLLFDGLDEVTKAAEARDDRRGQVTELIEQFSRQYDGCHIVVTCRIAATEYMFDPAFSYLELADFAPDQVDAFVRNWFWDPANPDQSAGLAERMLAEYDRPEHVGIRDLSRNPLLLTLLCLTYAETLSFPARRVEIYEEALDALLKKWDASRQIQRGSLYKQVSLGRKRQMFSHIAYDAFVRGEIVFRQADLERWLVDYLAHVPELPQAIDIDGEIVLKEIVAQHGVFVEQAHGLFSFAHLTFQEFYATCHITDNVAAGTVGTLLQHVEDRKWREVFLLTAVSLPDGTGLLAGIEDALHRALMHIPELITALRWIAAKARTSEAKYRQPATRAFYINKCSGDLLASQAFAFDFDVALDENLAWDREIDRSLTDLHDFGYHAGQSYAHKTGSDLVEWRELFLELCQQKQTSLHTAVLGLDALSANAAPEEWVRFTAGLIQLVEAQGTLTRYRQLQDEAKAVENESRLLSMFNLNDRSLLRGYRYLTRLFYDCLQMANVPDRRGFEERMFLPPP